MAMIVQTEIGEIEDTRKRFFTYARERHNIHIARAAGAPRAMWTRDPILQQFRFTNVFRELDKTTAWFRHFVRRDMRKHPDVMLATVLFRMLNRIEIGEAVFLQGILNGGTAWEVYRDGGFKDTRILRQAIRAFCPDGPYVTGAYIISTPPGQSKLDGVLGIVDGVATRQCVKCSKADWQCAANWMLWDGRGSATLERTWRWLGEFPYLGKFHAYEIVTDLRHTALLDCAPDINTWANMGPGARRGLNRIAERRGEGTARRALGGAIPEEQALDEMRGLLADSRKEEYWPQNNPDYPAWELREVEHTLCEFDKYERVRNGDGRPRGVFR